MDSLLIILIFIYFILVSIYAFFGWTKNKVKEAVFKCLSSIMFVLIGVYSLSLNKALSSSFDIFIIMGLITSLIGDFILSFKCTDKIIFCGLSAFLFTHGEYFVACVYLSRKYGDSGILNVTEVVAIIILSLLVLIFTRIFKLKPGKLLIPIAIYTIVITSMTVKAFTASLLVISKEPELLTYGILLMSGATSFLISDIVLSLTYFSKDNVMLEKAKPFIGLTNIVFYFGGQLLIALSLLKLR